MSILQYDIPIIIDYDKLHPETKKILEWVGYNQNVAEFGCHTGFLSYWLKKHGNTVTGVEINEQALNKAKEYLQESYAGNIEDEKIWNKFTTKYFSVVLYLHVLEHLADPWTALRRTHHILADDGILIVALPNISNAKNRFDMFFGKFEYEETGVMDRTHLRFFNNITAHHLLEECGYKVLEYYAPQKVSPLKHLLNHFPLLWRLTNKMNEKPSRIYSDNLTNLTMLFKCKLK